MIDMKDINRPKLILVEKKVTLLKIAELLNSDRKELINKSK